MKVSWDSVKQALMPIAGIAANAIVPGSGGFVSGMLSNVLGVENTPEGIMAGLATASPEQIAAIKKMELENKKDLAEIAAQIDIAHLKDRQGARDREVAIAGATGGKDTNLYFLAWCNVFGFFGVLIAVIVVDMPEGDVAKTAIAMLLGALIASYKDVTGYFFGSSKGSADKNKLIAAKSNE